MNLFNEIQRKLNVEVKHRHISQESVFIEICPPAKTVNVMREFTFYHNPVSEKRDIVSNTHSRFLYTYMGTAVAQWPRCCATNRKVAGSIPDGVIGIFRWHNPSDRTMALESTKPLTEMSTRSIS